MNSESLTRRLPIGRRLTTRPTEPISNRIVAMRILLLIPLATIALAQTPPDPTRQGPHRRRSAQQSQRSASSQGLYLIARFGDQTAARRRSRAEVVLLRDVERRREIRF